MVMAMMMAATIQAAAIHNPPKTIQSMFRNIETGGMRFLRNWIAVALLRRATLYPAELRVREVQLVDWPGVGNRPAPLLIRDVIQR
jgi:hypothetical protein